MKTIYKFPLEITGTQTIRVPLGAKFLCLKAQRNIPVTYWLVDPDNFGGKNIDFNLFGTEHPILGIFGYYIDSVICNGGDLVRHVFCKQNIMEQM